MLQLEMARNSQDREFAAGVDVSVIVCTYNRAELLGDAVRSLDSLQTHDELRFEIVIVDNASADETASVARELQATCSAPVRYVYEPKPGVSAARNRGIAEAQGEWIAFMDDDQIADEHWLWGLLSAARRRAVRCVGGVNRLRLPAGQQTRRLAPSLESLLGATQSSAGERPYTDHHAPGAGNLLVHRSVFEEIGTFDESLAAAGEDLDLYRRMRSHGIRAWCTSHAVTLHVVPASRLEPRYLRWKCYRNGGHLAHRDWCEKGVLRMGVNAALRLIQSAAVHGPRAGWGFVRGDAEAVLGAQCLLWRAGGYLRFALHYAAPSIFPQRRFLEWMDFRAERTMLAAPMGASHASLGAAP
jgi:glycosyltransferase involved in cell wall biosynthesis